MKKGIIVGIDLGTSTSEIAILKDGKPLVIKNHNGEFITPSVVGKREDGSIVVGAEAKDQLLAKPKDTVMEVKRLMGSNELVEISGKKYKPQEVSAEILKYLKGCAEEYVGESIDRAVITVPAYFTDEQRRATVEAGKIAGFQVERIINEPTAAALAYGLENMEAEENVLVYDLGGGTLDVTLLEMFDGVLEVKASSGNNTLGGKDFDERLVTYIIEQFNNEHKIDLSKDIHAMVRLKDEAEICKKNLTVENQYKIVLPFIADKQGEPIALETTITREIFEDLIKDLIDSSKVAIDVVLNDSKLKVEDINTILMVGGSTRIPYVKRFLKENIKKEPRELMDPDLAVVMGAAVQSGIIDSEFDEETGIMITDVCPYTLGIEVMDIVLGVPTADRLSVIIPRNITIPVTKEEIYTTVQDYQSKVEIKVYQGDNKKASRNSLLGNFTLDNIPESLAGVEKIKVSFSYDINGILQVEATNLSTEKKVAITIETTGVEMKEQVQVELWKESPISKAYKGTIRKVERFIGESDEGNVEELEELLYELKEAIVLEDKNRADDLEEELMDLLYESEEI